MAKFLPWIWVAVGAAMALIGGGLKADEVMKSPGVFEFVFFSGADYVLLIAGLSLLIAGLCSDLLFSGSSDPTPSSGSKR